jgi:hypothetical protein
MLGEKLAHPPPEDKMRRLTLGLAFAAVTTVACNRTTAPGADGPSSETAGTTAAAKSAPAPVHTSAVWHEVTLPTGTHLPVVLDTAVGSDTSSVEEPVRAHLSRPIVLEGREVLPSGSQVTGVVTGAQRAGRVKGLAHIALRFDTLVPGDADQRYRIQTEAVGRTAPATKKKDALEIGAPAAGGALVGALIGGKKGALIGTAVGGGAGTAVVLSTRGQEIRLGRGAPLTLRLTEPVTVRTKG